MINKALYYFAVVLYQKINNDDLLKHVNGKYLPKK